MLFFWRLRRLLCGSVALLWLISSYALAAEPPAKKPITDNATSFYRGFNLNGPSLLIDGNLWEAGDSELLLCDDARFENQSVPLVPMPDESRARMLRASLFSPTGNNRIVLKKLDPGSYQLFLYVWEDNDSQTFDVLIDGHAVQSAVVSGPAGHWQKLGPFAVSTTDETIEVTSVGGHANFSGLELWRQGKPPAALPVADAAAAEHFDTHVAPILARRCLTCHNANDQKGSLDLSRHASAWAGGDSGQVIVPGQPDESLLWLRVEQNEMPPDDPLSAEEASVLRDWIVAGAPWGKPTIDPFRYSSERRAGYDWWSLQAVTRSQPPATKQQDWSRGPLDPFVLARLEAAGLSPSPAASRAVLIRRVYFDVIGLPPSPDEVAAFVADDDPAAYEKLVDRLLSSPRYGERWARHWLDIVRFGESQGFERNFMRDNAWKYRDWVIHAFNSDLPYDEFVRLQLTGDVLHPDDPLAVIASTFLVAGPYDLTAYTDGTQDMKAFARQEELEGLVGTVSQTFMGLTVNCARCHDHKFDAITQREYYQIASTLAGTYHGEERECLPAGQETTAARVQTLRDEIAAIPPAATPAEEVERQLLIDQRTSLVRLLQGGPAHLTVPQEPGVVRILARGDFKLPREPVTPAGIAAVRGVTADWDLREDAPEAARRKALAAWITDPAHPLTARVLVNRLWSHHFGEGLVLTPNDFGFNGGQPSHPELLDWLASELVAPQTRANDREPSPAPWSIKHLQRLILLSATYQQSSQQRAAAMQIDADNRLLWRHSPQRLEAEAVRDAVLCVSGELNPTMGGPGYRDFTTRLSSKNHIYEVIDAVGPEFNRRSIYRTWIRTGTHPFLDVLDCPDPSVATPRRSVTTTPLQALSLLNNAFMERSAAAWAERLQAAEAEPTERINQAYRAAFGRDASEEERAFAVEFVAQHGLAQFCLVLFNTNEFLYLD